MNAKIKKTEDEKDIFEKTVANGLWLLTNKQVCEVVKLKIQEILFQAQLGAFGNQNSQSHLLNHNFNFKRHPVGLYQVKDVIHTLKSYITKISKKLANILM